MRTTLLAVWGWVLLSSCGGSNHADAVANYHAFVDAVFRTYCQAELSCCGQASPYMDLPSCIAAKQQSTWQPAQVSDQELSEGIVVFDTAEAQACLATLSSATASCDNTIDISVANAYFCEKAIRGTLSVGATCSYRDSSCDCECVAGASCSTTPPDSAHWWLGTCVAVSTSTPPPVADGGACTTMLSCQSLNCVNGVCAAELTLRQALCGG